MTFLTLKYTQIPPHEVISGALKRIRFFALLLAVFVTGCGNPVNVKNPYVLPDADDAHVAKIYFLRPQPYKYKGVSDNKISVDFKDEKLLEINEGQYTLIKLKPSTGNVTTHSKTQFTNKTVPIDVSRSREYRFIAGKTYFIYLKRVNEEFRGIFYDPAPVSLSEALQIGARLSALGLAKKEPIEKVSMAKDTPAPSPLKPAYPENLYPGTPYLIKGNPKYKAPEHKETPPEGKNEMTFDQPPQESNETGTK